VNSVGSRGDSYDNALAESFNGLYKTELIHRQGPWRNVEHVEWATLTYVDWFKTDGSTTRSARSRRQRWKRTTTVRSTPQSWCLHKQQNLYETRADSASRRAAVLRCSRPKGSGMGCGPRTACPHRQQRETCWHLTAPSHRHPPHSVPEMPAGRSDRSGRPPSPLALWATAPPAAYRSAHREGGHPANDFRGEPHSPFCHCSNQLRTIFVGCQRVRERSSTRHLVRS
jgi:hypothetical protein